MSRKASAVAFRPSDDLITALGQGLFEDVTIRVRGDYLTDNAGRCVAAEFFRQKFPTGDPTGSGTVALQGQEFMSWVFLRRG